jgi:hypothetical protein
MQTFPPFRLQTPLVVKDSRSVSEFLPYRPALSAAPVTPFPRASVGLRHKRAGSPRRKAESSSYPTDWWFVSGCSPPRLATTQLPSTTKFELTSTGTCTPLIHILCKRTLLCLWHTDSKDIGATRSNLYDPSRVGAIRYAGVRWCRFAQPPAHSWEPSGFVRRMAFFLIIFATSAHL